MAAQITIRGEVVLAVSVYAPSGKAEREALFEMTCWNTKDPCSWAGISTARVLSSCRSIDMNRWRLRGQAQLCDVLEDDIERAEEERVISVFHATAHTYFYTFPGTDQQVLVLTGGM